MLLNKECITLELKLKDYKTAKYSLKEVLEQGIIDIHLKKNEKFNLSLESEVIIHNYPEEGEIHLSKVKKIKTKYRNLSGDIEYVNYSLELYE